MHPLGWFSNKEAGVWALRHSARFWNSVVYFRDQLTLRDAGVFSVDAIFETYYCTRMHSDSRLPFRMGACAHTATKDGSIYFGLFRFIYI